MLPQEPAAGLDGFVLGVNIEELYCLFGEQYQTMTGGISRELHASGERKLGQVLAALGKLGLPATIADGLSPVRARLEQLTGSAASDPAAIHQDVAASQQTAANISRLMGTIREGMDDAVGNQYDSGIFCAHLSLCARMVRIAGDAQDEPSSRRKDLYGQELKRSARSYLGVLARALKNKVFIRPFPRISHRRSCAWPTSSTRSAPPLRCRTLQRQAASTGFSKASSRRPDSARVVPNQKKI